MERVCVKVQRVAPYDVTVLLSGESGTGKELCARALHYNSLRWDKPFVVENCAALPDELLESELFGYKRVLLPVRWRIAQVVRACRRRHHFSDEIGEVSAAFQVKLLRVLQEGEIRPLGCAQRRKVDVRVIAATNRSWRQRSGGAVSSGSLLPHFLLHHRTAAPARKSLGYSAVGEHHFERDRKSVR